jgi:hypothetical protein
VIQNSLTYPSEKLVETVGTSVNLMESMMAEVAHLDSQKQCLTAAIKNSIDFEWIRSTGCSLQCEIPKNRLNIRIHFVLNF